MTPSLRKRHRVIWLILALLLPLLFGLAIWSIPKDAVQEKLYQSTSSISQPAP